MKLLRSVFSQRRAEQIVCFKVVNFEDIYQRDPEVITRLENNLTLAGAIPAKIDFTSQLCCATVTDPSVKPADIQQVLEDLGFHVITVEPNSQ